MPLESLFSVQVTQPYLNESFPVQPNESHEDRLFRHITFPENDKDVTLRLRAINQNHITESSVIQKHVQTNLFINDPTEEIFRVKAVLSQLEHGIDESYWVENKNLDSQEAISHNQYRIRGVSDKHWKSDWVYSEIRDEENDLIVYNMLHDVLDLLLTVHDDQLEHLMDYIVSDTFIQVIREKLPQFATSIDLDEFKTATIAELLTIIANRVENNPNEKVVTQIGENFMMLADELKREFKESIMSSQKEFAELYRIYKLFDQYSSRQQDAMTLLVEIFLQDRYEKLVQKTDIEVLLRNDEEMGIYLDGRYEFDIKSELINAVYSASLNDGFVTKLDDAVSLLGEPVVYESLVYQQDETVEKFLRLVLAEVYTPLVAADKRLLELEHALEDAHDFKSSGSIVEFATIKDGEELRTMLLFDVVEALFMGDIQLRYEYEVTIMDRVLKFMNDSRKALLIDYNFGEFVQIFLSLGESFRHQYSTLFNQPNEPKVVHLTDHSQVKSSASIRSPKESYTAALHDTYRLSLIKEPENIKESTHVALIDSILSHYDVFKKSVNEVINAAILDRAIQQSTMDHATHKESLISGQIDTAILKDINAYYQTQEHTSMHPEYMYYNLYKHYLREPNRYPVLERKDVEVLHDLRDMYIIDGEDTVQYAIGDMGEGWPLGVFRLGINTLKGEVQNQ